MFPGLLQLMRSRGFATVVHLLSWLLLYLALTHLRGTSPPYAETEGRSQPAVVAVPVAKFAGLFAAPPPPYRPVATNAFNPFYTLHFVPPPTPPPPPPTTRKFELTYLGYYQVETGEQKAMLKLTNDFILAPVGGRVLSNLFVHTAEMRTLVLTNPAAQTNLLPINVPKVVEVPIQ